MVGIAILLKQVVTKQLTLYPFFFGFISNSNRVEALLSKTVVAAMFLGIYYNIKMVSQSKKKRP